MEEKPQMTPQQLQQLDQYLNQWRAKHSDAESLQAAYRQQVLKFTLSSMALENEPVDPKWLAKLLNQPAR
ncbi:MAG: hypothetical protein L0H75_00505 [Nitrosospira sp.]|nr:hypothetical protein [Nitrosospira sp.]MDN5934641.1 hypothetical protein [Nitrosospira sp.]